MDQERFNRAIALQDSGKVEEALQEFHAMAEETADQDEKAVLLLSQATCCAIMNAPKQAREYVRHAIRLSRRPEIRARADFTEAALQCIECRFEDSLRALDRLIVDYGDLLRTPDHRDLYEEIQIRRAILFVEFGRHREARPILEEALTFQEAQVDRGQIHYNLGVCLFNLGDKMAAKENFLEVLRDREEDYYTISARYYLGVIYSQEGAYAKALREFERVEAHAAEANIDKEKIYGWLARVSRLLRLDDDAERYEKLAKS